MDLAALSDPEDSEEQRARLRASADRDASVLATFANDGSVVIEPSGGLETESADPLAPVEPIPPEPVVTYRGRAVRTTVRLRFPFDIEGIKVRSVSMVPPTFADVEALTAGRISELEMFARMCGLPVMVLRAMRWPDVETVTLFARHLAPDLQRG
ncbi:hypothetical protein [Aureimonas pseudogalii]|uniref:Phage tail assembly protein n=1 Tax=Aureimonas pseudogalii TaxID=1744844 RepID=A0A7W6EB82_9HYPH|nr:hypothetical protein [Aureimonas pseudogalii]MBB3996866.1 hypothetical protein [Aureimonas pseudogalii]